MYKEPTVSPVVFGYVKIYTLSDLQGNIFYVGATAKTAAERLKGHISEAKSNKSNDVNIRKIEKIRGLDYKIAITVVDCVFTSAPKFSELVYLRKALENKWIKTYANLGYNLLNRMPRKKTYLSTKELIGHTVMSTELMGEHQS